MTCRTVSFGGGTAIVCSRGQRRRSCSTPNCTRTAELLCDHPVTRKGKVGTCDRPICSRCAVSQGENTDYCQAHGRALKEGAPGAQPALGCKGGT